VVPTYNEAENVGILLDRVRRAIGGSGIEYEVVVVDDSSSDGTAEVARRVSEELGVPLRLVVRRGERGLASAVARGFREAGGEYIAVMDADLQHPPEVLAEMLSRALGEGADIVVASRYVGGGGVEGWGLHRRLASRLATIAARVLIPQARRVRDPLSGFFLVRRGVIEGISPEALSRGRSFKILLEILVRGRYGKVVEHPYRFKPRERGKSKLGAREAIEFVRQVVELSDYRLLKFVAVGLSGVLVNNIVLYMLAGVSGVPVYIASPIAIEVATINNFTLNDRWTFKRFRELGRLYTRLAKYHVAVGLGNLVNYAVVLALHTLVGIIPSNILGIGLGFITNYLVSSEFVWEVSKGLKTSQRR